MFVCFIFFSSQGRLWTNPTLSFTHTSIFRSQHVFVTNWCKHSWILNSRDYIHIFLESDSTTATIHCIAKKYSSNNISSWYPPLILVGHASGSLRTSSRWGFAQKDDHEDVYRYCRCGFAKVLDWHGRRDREILRPHSWRCDLETIRRLAKKKIEAIISFLLEINADYGHLVKHQKIASVLIPSREML